jgi:uncharacterized protein YijF (DUF1287 family)
MSGVRKQRKPKSSGRRHVPRPQPASLSSIASPSSALLTASVSAAAAAIHLRADERFAFALLLAPFFVMALAITASPTLSALPRLAALSSSSLDGDEAVPVRAQALTATVDMEIAPVSAVPPKAALSEIHAAPPQRALTQLPLANDAQEKVALPAAPLSPEAMPVANAPESLLHQSPAAFSKLAPANVCAAMPRRNGTASARALRNIRANISNASFGARLAAAAVAQIFDFVIYDSTYRSLSYPLGDVAPLYGVCTDVVIRAYRALGIDLQALVQRTGVGTGDSSIDHRRTEILRRFFSLYGQRLPVTEFADDYRPGDIVAYHRPQNTRVRSHIAIVSDQPGPSGKPMIVHNRGWGPQLEDALFVDEITGHYRFVGFRGETSEMRFRDRRADIRINSKPARASARNEVE